MNIEEVLEDFKEYPDDTILKFTQNVVDYIEENTMVIHSKRIVKSNLDKDVFYDKIIEYYSVLYSIFNHGDITTGINFSDLEGKFQQDLIVINIIFNKILEDYKAIATKAKFKSMTNKYSGLFKNEFMYHFSDSEVTKIQELINILREEISKSTLFENEHQQRLLKRLEKLQAEIHKKMSDLDRFWGLVGDAGVAIGKFGKDAKPIVDRIRELTDVVWGAQRRAEQLPDNSSNPLLDNEN